MKKNIKHGLSLIRFYGSYGVEIIPIRRTKESSDDWEKALGILIVKWKILYWKRVENRIMAHIPSYQNGTTETIWILWDSL